ncbi:MAG: hypothetical protein GY910_25180 [bacterium]|nr:hypothetical protein [Deltaproteobacteria bacterium]MCP4908280.1 hypothetical protein [bacterium]
MQISRFATGSSRRAVPSRCIPVMLLIVMMLLPGERVLAECSEEGWATAESLASPRTNDLVAAGADGIGGSGFGSDPGDDDGIGGSGYIPADESPDDGIGGSGLFGTITGFGSVCVNGGRVRYDDSVAVSIDAVSAAVGDLAVGQVIRINLETREDGVYAREIDVQHEVLGPITAAGGDGIDVMGQRVSLEYLADHARSEIEVGARVAVSGLRRSDGTVVASRIVPAPSTTPDLTRGVPMSVDESSFRIGGTLIAPLAFDPSQGSGLSGRSAPHQGGREIVQGSWNVELGRLEASRRGASPVASAHARQVDLEGYVERNEAGVLAVGGVAFSVGEGAATIRSGERVRVRGVREAAGETLRLRRVMRVAERPMFRALDPGVRPPQVLRPDLRGQRPHPPRPHRIRRPPPRNDRLPPRRPPPS